MVELVHTLSKRLRHIIIKSWAVLVWQVVLGRIFLSFASEFHSERIYFDATFFSEMLKKLNRFYFDILLNASVQWMYTFVGGFDDIKMVLYCV